MQRPGAEEFGCVSLLVAPFDGPFRSLIHNEYVPGIANSVARCPRQITLMSMLIHEVDTRASTLARMARQAANLPIQALPGPAFEIGLEGREDGRWMLNSPRTFPPVEGPPLLSRYQIWRPQSKLDLLIGCRGDFLPRAQEPRLQDRRRALAADWPEHLQLLSLETQGEADLERALNVAMWQASTLIPAQQ